MTEISGRGQVCWFKLKELWGASPVHFKFGCFLITVRGCLAT